MSKQRKKNKGFNNKGPRYYEKFTLLRKKLSNFFRKESKRKHSRKINHE